VKEPEWVLRETVFILHEQSLAKFGGAAGIRDHGLLDSALSRPQNAFPYGKPTLYTLSAGYAFGLAKNHPFTDGNKRTAFVTAVLFLELNGLVFRAGEVDATVQTLALAAGEIGEAEYTDWLKRNSRKG
jgi:death on curing protein